MLVKIPVGLLDKKHMEAGRPSTLSGKGIKPIFGKCRSPILVIALLLSTHNFT